MSSVFQLPYKEWGIFKKNSMWQFFLGRYLPLSVRICFLKFSSWIFPLNFVRLNFISCDEAAVTGRAKRQVGRGDCWLTDRRTPTFSTLAVFLPFNFFNLSLIRCHEPREGIKVDWWQKTCYYGSEICQQSLSKVFCVSDDVQRQSRQTLLHY